MFQFVIPYIHNLRHYLFTDDKKNITNELIYKEQHQLFNNIKTYYMWCHKDDIAQYLKLEDIEIMNDNFHNAFINNKYLDNKYNALLGIREYDTEHFENYKELSDLYKNGLTINSIDVRSQTHPIIQSIRMGDMFISPRLETYFNNSIHSFYIRSINKSPIKLEDTFDYNNVIELDYILN